MASFSTSEYRVTVSGDHVWSGDLGPFVAGAEVSVLLGVSARDFSITRDLVEDRAGQTFGDLSGADGYQSLRGRISLSSFNGRVWISTGNARFLSAWTPEHKASMALVSGVGKSFDTGSAVISLLEHWDFADEELPEMLKEKTLWLIRNLWIPDQHAGSWQQVDEVAMETLDDDSECIVGLSPEM